jgi:hypothetical protein
MSGCFMKFIRTLLTVVGWSFAVASIVLQCLYERPILSEVDLALLFLVSLLAGAALYDAKKVMLGFVVSLGLSSLIIFIFLSSPAFLGMARHLERVDILYAGNVTMMFRNMFPLFFVSCFIGAVVGGFLGEKYVG